MSTIATVQAFAKEIIVLSKLADECNDIFANTILEGSNCQAPVLGNLIALSNLAAAHNLSNALTISVDGSTVATEEVQEMIDTSSYPRGWRVVVSKSSISAHLKAEDPSLTIYFFVTAISFRNWSEAFDPLRGRDNPFADQQSVAILAPDIASSFGGPFLLVAAIDKPIANAQRPNPTPLPAEDVIRQNVHMVPSEPIRIAPHMFALTWGDLEQSSAEPFRRFSSLTLAASIADVFYDRDRVVIKGVRHLEVPLSKAADGILSTDELRQLCEAVHWIYEERTETRKKLLADRLSLDSDQSKSLVANLAVGIRDALTQSRDQYRFVILDRKDEYSREVRELLKDLREQAELYATKIRSLIEGLSRDALAAFVFIGLSLTADIGEDIELLSTEAAFIFFKALSVYFIASMLLQVVAAYKDVKLSSDELTNWSQITRDYIGPEELRKYIANDLEPRRKIFYWFLGIVAAIYVALGVASWNMRSTLDYFEILRTQKPTVTIIHSTTKTL